ncbi:MAG: hypothetical protein IJ489_08435 [Clostridia bacterium]|nr:hypothetical protein [Clostridia bacterium]
MNNFLKNIWNGNECPIETPLVTDEMRHLEQIIEKHKLKLSENLNEYLQETLEKYDRYLTELLCISEETAFIKGIRFASQFFMEALSNT